MSSIQGQGKLFQLAIEGVSVQAHYRHGHGWEVALTWRRQGEGWASDPWHRFDHLTTGEMLDVIAVELELALGD